jgi:lipopolysaccharide export system protein LptC
MNRMAFLLLSLATLAATGCRAPKASEAQAVAPELKLDGVRFRVYRGEELRAFGLSDSAALRRDSSEVRAEQLEATLPRGAEPLLITAPVGEGSLLSRVFDVSGGIAAERGDDVARTDGARYEPIGPDGVVRGDDPVVVAGPGYRLEGRGFTLDPAAGTIVMGGGARLVAGLGGEAAP